MLSSEVRELQEKVKVAQAELAKQLEGISELELYRPPAEGEWSVAQILAHVCEMEPFWTGRVYKMCQEEHPDIGRTDADSRRREEVVVRQAMRPLSVLRQGLLEADNALLTCVVQLSPEVLKRRGSHPRWGELTVAELLVERIVSHILEHAQQVAENRRKIGQLGLTPQREVRDYQERIRAAQQELGKQAEGVSEANAHKAPAEGEWSIAEVLIHMSQFQRSWATDVRRLCQETDPLIGPTQQDVQERIREMTELAKRPLSFPLGQLRESNAELLNLVASLSPEQLGRKGRHTRGGERSVRQVLEHMVVHAKEHAHQIADTHRKVASA